MKTRAMLATMALVAATSCARVHPQPNPDAMNPAAAQTEWQRKSVSGVQAPDDADYLEYYRSTCHITADTPPDPATLAKTWRNARQLSPEDAARVSKYRATCHIK